MLRASGGLVPRQRRGLRDRTRNVCEKHTPLTYCGESDSRAHGFLISLLAIVIKRCHAAIVQMGERRPVCWCDSCMIPSMPQPVPAQIEEGIIEVLKNVSRRTIEPTLDSDLVVDLGFDSLQVLELIAELEDRFDISIPLNYVPTTRTVAQVAVQVAALVGGRGNAG